MDVACPNCATRFRVPEGAIGEAGRIVRCSKCEHTWRQFPVEPEPEPEKEAPPAEEAPAAGDEPAVNAQNDLAPAEETDQPIRPEIMAAGAEIDTPPPIGGDLLSDSASFPEKSRGKGKGGSLATVLWILLLIVVAGSAAGAWYKRDWIMANYPASQPIYASLGLVEAEGPPPLAIRDVKSVKRTLEGERRYIISGMIENTSNDAHPIPPMRGLIFGDGGQELVRWDFDSGTATLAGRSSVAFETSVAAPEGAQNLTIDFVLEE